MGGQVAFRCNSWHNRQHLIKRSEVRIRFPFVCGTVFPFVSLQSLQSYPLNRYMDKCHEALDEYLGTAPIAKLAFLFLIVFGILFETDPHKKRRLSSTVRKSTVGNNLFIIIY